MIYKYTAICLMALITLFVIHLMIVGKITDAYAEHNNKLFSDSTNSGLYAATDKVALLTVSNFDENVYNSSSAWIVQFYNSWCGHCIKFAPTYKLLATEVYNWRHIVTLGAINCADDQNSQHCRNYEIMGYPTLRYFAPMTANFTIGENVVRTKDDPAVLRHEIINKLQKTETNVPTWPDFSAIDADNLPSLWVNKSNNLLILVVESEDSYTGRDLILDLLNVQNLMVHHTFDADFAKSGTSLPQVFAIKSDLSRVQIPLQGTSRMDVFESAQKYLNNLGYTVINTIESVSKETNSVRVKQSLSQKRLVNKVYVNDLETALSFSLLHEIGLHSTITEGSLAALKDYLRVLNKYFPFTSKKNFVHDLAKLVEDKTNISGEDFTQLALSKYEDYPPLSKKWVGCKGSTAKYRGYPCGMWMMFHTLSIRAYVYSETTPSESKEVLNAMTNYIKHFFGCATCANHFAEMAETINSSVFSLKDSVLWLWRAHNTVNKRLAGDLSEDPSFPKIQFPDSLMCPECRHANSSWHEEKVFLYLVHMYSNLDNVSSLSSASALEASFQEEEVEVERHPKDGWNFKWTDVNTCIGLYVMSACLLTVYTVRFFMKRSRRSKSYRFDGFSKA